MGDNDAVLSAVGVLGNQIKFVAEQGTAIAAKQDKTVDAIEDLKENGPVRCLLHDEVVVRIQKHETDKAYVNGAASVNKNGNVSSGKTIKIKLGSAEVSGKVMDVIKLIILLGIFAGIGFKVFFPGYTPGKLINELATSQRVAEAGTR